MQYSRKYNNTVSSKTGIGTVSLDSPFLLGIKYFLLLYYNAVCTTRTQGI